jgi:hypothetical protein
MLGRKTTRQLHVPPFSCTHALYAFASPAAGCPILVEKPFGGILEHSFHCNAERLVLRLRQRFERLSRLAGDYCDGRSAVPKDRRAGIVGPGRSLRRDRDPAGVLRVFYHRPPGRHVCAQTGRANKKSRVETTCFLMAGFYRQPTSDTRLLCRSCRSFMTVRGRNAHPNRVIQSAGLPDRARQRAQSRGQR